MNGNSCSLNASFVDLAQSNKRSEVLSSHLYNCKETCTVDYNQVPPSTVKQCVIHGYIKPNQPRLFYLKTMWTLTNETINVWSHLCSGIFFLWMLYSYSKEMNIVVDWPVLVIILSSCGVTFCSAVAHIFHSRSEFDHCSWMLFDFFGIILFSYGSTVTHFFACSELSHYQRFGYWNIVMLTFNCGLVFTLLAYTKIPNKGLSIRTASLIRILVLGYGYLYGLLPVILRCIYFDPSRSTQYHILSIVFMSIAPFLYATNKPQFYSPGTFDIFGHNHQLFHVCISVMLYFDVIAVHWDVTSSNGHWKELKKQADHPELVDISIFAFILVLWCAATACICLFKAKKEIEKQRKE